MVVFVELVKKTKALISKRKSVVGLKQMKKCFIGSGVLGVGGFSALELQADQPLPGPKNESFFSGRNCDFEKAVIFCCVGLLIRSGISWDKSPDFDKVIL